jgi:hypothetical protein
MSTNDSRGTGDTVRLLTLPHIMESESEPRIELKEKTTNWNFNIGADHVYDWAKALSKGVFLGFCEALALVAAILFVIYHVLKFINDL